MSGGILGEEEMMVGLFQAEGVDEFVVFLEVVVIAQKEDDFIDVVFVGDG